MKTAKRLHNRARRRGFTISSVILELAMIAGWFVVLIVSEKALSDGVNARRSVEDSATASATQSSAAFCASTLAGIAQDPRLPRPSLDVAIESGELPSVAKIFSMLMALGMGSHTSFAYYTLPSLRIRVDARVDDGHGNLFKANRGLGCLERSLALPSVAMEIKMARLPMWLQNIMGY